MLLSPERLQPSDTKKLGVKGKEKKEKKCGGFLLKNLYSIIVLLIVKREDILSTAWPGSEKFKSIFCI